MKSEKQMSNDFLSGNFAPVHEEVDIENLTLIEGEIPSDLNGYFLRIGPNPQFSPPDIEKYHWFDGDGMIHQMAISEGKANYKNRWLRTRGFELEAEKGNSIWKGFQSLHELEVHHGMMTKNVANTAMLQHNGKLLALWEAGLPHVFNLHNLDTVAEEDFSGTWHGSVSAHPKVCPWSGELIVFGYNVVGEYGFSYGVYDPEGNIKHKADIKLKGKPVMIHDCAITPDYTLILDFPVTFSLERAMAGGAAFAWEEDNGARIGLLPRYGQNEDVIWFEVNPGFIFHVFNAWQEGDVLVLEACRSNCSSVISETGTDALDQKYSFEDEQGRAYQYTLNVKTGEVFETQIYPQPCEFAQINPAYLGKKHSYAYASRFANGQTLPLFDGVLKFNREENKVQTHAFPTGVFGGEFVFAPSENPQTEDDGYLLGLVQDTGKNRSLFYILDAINLESRPLAIVEMPVRVPYGFHAAWISG